MRETKADERRSRSRIATRVPVAVRAPNGNVEASAVTRDLSLNGIFLYTDSEIQVGSELEMVLMLPEQLMDGEKRWVCCQASVVRVERTDGKPGIGVAASVKNMQVLPEITS